MASERRSLNLKSVRADDWFDRVADSAPNFEQLCSAIGRRFVAFSLVAGVRITALAIDPRNPEQTRVSFAIGGQKDEHELALPEFRRALTQALVQDDAPAGPVPDDLDDAEALQTFIGVRYLLLATIFGVQAHELRVGGDEPPTMVIRLGGLADEVSIEEFRDVIREAVRREEQSARPQQQRPFSIDLSRIPEAERALARGDHDRTIEILDPWAGPLSMLLRTPQGQNLGPDAKAALARALGLLGTAYLRKQDFPTAEEILRLGVQWVQDGPVAGELFSQLGELALAQEQPGQAIGLFRRAQHLGAPKSAVLPRLAECFVRRGRAVAALVCLDEAQALGVPDDQTRSLRAVALDKVGGPYAAFRALVPAPGPATN